MGVVYPGEPLLGESKIGNEFPTLKFTPIVELNNFEFQNRGETRGHEDCEEVVQWMNGLSKSSLIGISNGMLLYHQKFSVFLLLHPLFRLLDEPLFLFFF